MLFHLCIACAWPMKMSLFSYNPPNQLDQLDEDVLLAIFDQLHYQDLLRCEAVCRQWRNVLLSGTPWRRLFHRKIISSEQWRDIVRLFGVDVKKLETVHYRSLCRGIHREEKQTDRNWRTGNFKNNSPTNFLEDIAEITVWGDRIAVYSWYQSMTNLMYLVHRTSLEEISSIEIHEDFCAVTNTEIVVVWDMKNMKILDTNGRLISEVPELDEKERISWNLESCCITGNQMAVLSQTEGKEKLSFWDVSDPLRATRLKSKFFNLGLQLECEDYEISMKMDDEFIAISNFQGESTSFYFFSKETLDLHWSMQFDGNNMKNLSFGKGLLLVYVSKQNDKSEECGVIQVYDVTSRTYLREIPTTEEKDYGELDGKVGFNSKFIVVFDEPSNYRLPYKMNIYDLEAVKSLKSSANELLVHTFTMDLYCQRIVVTETEIFIWGTNKITILDFSSMDVFRNATNSVTLSSPWRSVWWSKGVDEEPLEPARHMEAYKTVLKYFHQLSMNCQKAVKRYPVVDPDIASFTLGDDFIGYRQRNPKMVIYDEEMNESFDEIKLKTVQISRTTRLSVMGKRIQIINIGTDKLIKEINLEKDAIGFHFGRNRIVFVSQIAEREHLFSVWKVESSVNLTHMKNVTIGENIPRYSFEDWLRVDEQFIAVKTPGFQDKGPTYYFLSLKTFQVERSLSGYFKESFCDGGYLFLMNNDCLVRILDVASGTFLHDIRVEPASIDYVVMARSNGNHSTLYVYDLKCLKETDTVPSHLLLTTIDLECQVKKMLMNETRIACLSKQEMFVVDLEPIDRLRCP